VSGQEMTIVWSANVEHVVRGETVVEYGGYFDTEGAARRWVEKTAVDVLEPLGAVKALSVPADDKDGEELELGYAEWSHRGWEEHEC